MVTSLRTNRLVLAARVLRAVTWTAAGVSLVYLWSHRPPPLVIETSSSVAPVLAELPPARSAAWYAVLYERDFKQPPIPKIKQEALPQSAPSGPMPTLVATLIDAQGRYAQVIGRSGKPQLRAENDSIDQYRIQAIEPGRAQLVDGGQSHWIEIPRRKDGSR